MKPTDYKKSGVDIKKADRLIQWIKKHTSVPAQPLGSDFACLFPFPEFSRYKEPVLAASTDGVGTKIKLASYFDEWEGIGQDLAAMCLNDLICTGAKPLFFLDYYACGQLNGSQAKSFLKGLEKACRTASCPLLGGETAELPDLYQNSDVDCAGFCVGVVEKSMILKAQNVELSDEIVAFKSSGFHSNGYSLLRKIYNTSQALKKNKHHLIKPTRLYTFLTPYLGKISGLKAMAHITGGGLDNLSRIIPSGLKAKINPWSVPSCFLDVKKKAGLGWKNLLNTFNCGLGLVVILKRKEILSRQFPSEEIIYLGKIEKRGQSQKAWKLNLKSMEDYNS